MSIATVVTGGYGSFGSVAAVVRKGYEAGAAAVAIASKLTLTVSAEDRTTDIYLERRSTGIAEDRRVSVWLN